MTRRRSSAVLVAIRETRQPSTSSSRLPVPFLQRVSNGNRSHAQAKAYRRRQQLPTATRTSQEPTGARPVQRRAVGEIESTDREQARGASVTPPAPEE